MKHQISGLLDAHLHLQNSPLGEVVDDMVSATRRAGIEQLWVNATSPEDWNEVADLADRFPEVVPFFGIHPWQVNAIHPATWDNTLHELLTRFPESGVGEIGLDKWIRDHDIAKQRELFLHQLRIAESLSRPVTVHCLQAWGHLRECMETSEYSRPFLLHSFGGPAEMVADFVARGAYFSISGYFFRPDKAAKLETFRAIPEDRILLETDAPDMLPPEHLISIPLTSANDFSPANHPANLRNIYEAYAQWRGCNLAEVISRMKNNAMEFLRKKPQ